MRRRVLVAILSIVASRGAAQDPFLVNTYTPREQANPSVADQNDGGFVVVWESLDQDGDYIGIFGQRFAADGGRRGGEFQVNQYVFGPQALPDVAAVPNGAFVVVWQGYGDGGDYADIFARRYASDGSPAGSEFQVNVPVSAYSIELSAAVAPSTDNGFTVVWDDFENVHARCYDSTGAPRGGSFVVNAATVGTQATAAIAGLPDGGFVVAWADGYYLDDGQDGSGYGVFGRRFDSGGNAVGTDFLINTSTLGDQYGPAVAATPEGGFVVVWQSFAESETESAIFARRYDSAGAALGGEEPVSGPSSGVLGPPAVAADDPGTVVSWSNSPLGCGASTVLVRRFDSTGVPAGPAFAVDAAANGDQKEPAARGLAGGYVVVWNEAGRDEGISNVRARIDSGTPGATATPSATAITAQTASATATSTGSPTNTAVAGTTPTVTVARPTATTGPSPCAGDCSGDGTVSVDELVLAVNIALGSQPSSRCPAVDADGDAAVTVSELIAAVNRTLGGCV